MHEMKLGEVDTREDTLRMKITDGMMYMHAMTGPITQEGGGNLCSISTCSTPITLVKIIYRKKNHKTLNVSLAIA
jgi:hypothetical protein